MLLSKLADRCRPPPWRSDCSAATAPTALDVLGPSKYSGSTGGGGEIAEATERCFVRNIARLASVDKGTLMRWYAYCLKISTASQRSNQACGWQLEKNPSIWQSPLFFGHLGHRRFFFSFGFVLPRVLPPVLWILRNKLSVSSLFYGYIAEFNASCFWILFFCFRSVFNNSITICSCYLQWFALRLNSIPVPLWYFDPQRTLHTLFRN